MMNEQQLSRYFDLHKLSQRARDYISGIRSSEPSRLVGINARTNVCTWVASVKMGHQIQTESRTVERSFATIFEYSNDVIEYWDQLEAVPIKRMDKNGRVSTRWYTPDFLLLRKTGPQIIETKAENMLIKLHKKYPSEWVRVKSSYDFKPATTAFEEIGIPYAVLSSADLNRIRVANLKLLLKARQSGVDVDERFIAKIKRKLNKCAWIKLPDLSKELGMSDLTVLLKCIDRGILFADIDNRLLAQPEEIWVTTTPELLAVCMEVSRDETHLVKEIEDFEEVSLGAVPDKSTAEKAVKKLQLIQSGVNNRSVRRWKQKIKSGEKIGLSPFQSLLDNNTAKGNREQRINGQVSDYLDWHIENIYESRKNLTIYKAHKVYAALAIKEHPPYPGVSRITYTARVKSRSPNKSSEKRGGKRAANAAKFPSDAKERALTAVLPFEVAAIDHYKADVFCVLAGPGNIVYVARPWITAMIDLHSKVILAFWVSFRNPSCRACAMIIRQCVRRYGRIPAEIIVDHGSEFISVYFQSLMAHLRVDLSLRPSADPRYGSEAERLYGEMKTQCIALQPGNLANYKVIRAVSGSFSPDKNAVLTIEDLLEELLIFMNWRNSTITGVNQHSPSNILENGLNRFSCMAIPAVEDKEFIVATAVETDEYKVDFARGIHTNGIHYWHPKIANVRPKRKDLDVRHEPENPYQIYAKILDKWVVCSATGITKFNTKSSIPKLAEATRILDGRTARDLAKQEADYELIRKLVEIRHPMSAEKVFILQEDGAEEGDDNLFAINNDRNIRPLNVSEWSAA